MGGIREAIFAGGCFWCMQPPFDITPGVVDTVVGYIGGKTADPTYEQISQGTTGHAEAIKVVYDPAQVSYEDLLAIFWRNVDPTTPGRQFCDIGSQYRAAIFPTKEQKASAENSLATAHKGLAKDFAAAHPRLKIATTIEPLAPFYRAEEYHQDYYKKNPVRYKYYRYRCGRDQRLKQIWGKP